MIGGNGDKKGGDIYYGCDFMSITIRAYGNNHPYR